jgi:hypothetical protein
MATRAEYRGLKDALDEGVKSLRKWHGHADSTSPVYFICLVLDPNIKDLYFRGQWKKHRYDAGISRLEEVVSYTVHGGVDVQFTDRVSDSSMSTMLHLALSMTVPLTLAQVSGHYPSSCVANYDVYADSPQVELEPSLNYGGSFLISTVQAFQQQDQAAEGPREELRQYLKTGIESTTDIIAWWGVSLILFWI